MRKKRANADGQPPEKGGAHQRLHKRGDKLRRASLPEMAFSKVTASGVCGNQRTLRIPYHNKADGFMAALVLSLNQIKFCEMHTCRPTIEWGPFPVCKYNGVRYPGRTPFFESSAGPNAFEYYFRPLCENPPSQLAAPMLSCEQREQVHRVLPWAVRTY